MHLSQTHSQSSPRRRSARAHDETLSTYLKAIGGHALLTRDEERALGHEIERLETTYWQSLLGHPPALPAVAAVLEEAGAEVAEMLAELREVASATDDARGAPPSRWNALTRRLARELVAHDVDRKLVRAADTAAQRAFDAAMADHACDDAARGDEKQAWDAYLRRVAHARADQRQAKARFTAANLRLVVTIARRCRQGSAQLMDLIQDGNLGLMKAVERFDPSRGFRFSTYAAFWIRQEIVRGRLNKGRTVRLPVHMRQRCSKIARAGQRIATRTGRQATLEELCAETGLDGAKVEAARRQHLGHALSLDQPVGDEAGRPMIDWVPDSDAPSPLEETMRRALDRQVPQMLALLRPLEADVLLRRFGLAGHDPQTLQRIGKDHDLSRERIRQIQAGALQKLRSHLSERERASAPEPVLR